MNRICIPDKTMFFLMEKRTSGLGEKDSIKKIQEADKSWFGNIFFLLKTLETIRFHHRASEKHLHVLCTKLSTDSGKETVQKKGIFLRHGR
jgi:hypothetical protein